MTVSKLSDGGCRWSLLQLVVVGLLLSALSCDKSAVPQYGLPITLGSTSDEVRKTLGGPTERYRPPVASDTAETIRNPGKDGKVIEWYYSSGIVGVFDRDRLTAITLHTYTDYQGFLVYSSAVVNDVRLTDSKQTIVSKLGKPTKIESDGLESGTDPDVPVVWPKESRYYWRFKDYLVEAAFLNQAQNVSEKEKLTFPKDKLISIMLTK
jgi:hypothetical protein